MSCNDSKSIKLNLGGCIPGEDSIKITAFESDCEANTLTISVVDGKGETADFIAPLCDVGLAEDWTIDKANVVTNYNEAAGTFVVTVPCIDRISGLNVGSFDLDLSPLIDIDTQITCAEIAAFVTIRDNADNGCIKELVFCVGTGDETVVGSINLSGFIVSFQVDPLNPCVIQGIRCDDSAINVVDLAGFVSSVEVDTDNPAQFNFLDCAGNEVGNIVIPGNFSCADLVGNIVLRDNADNACVKELVLCAGSASEEVAGSLDLSTFIDTASEEISCGLAVGQGVKKVKLETCSGIEFELPVGGCFYKTQDTTSLGSPGDLVALKPGAVAGEYALAQADDKANQACAVAEIASANQLKLIGGIQELAAPHGLAVGSKQVLSDTTAGGFIGLDAAELSETFDVYQPLITVLSEQCIKVDCQPAICKPDSCANEECLIAATAGTATDATDQPLLDRLQAIADGDFTNGCSAFVTPDDTFGSGDKLAVAEDCNAFYAKPIVDETGAVIGYTKLKVAWKEGETSFSVDLSLIPQSQVDGGGLPGTVVETNSLLDEDAHLAVGGTTATGCHHIVIEQKREGIPVDPNAPLYEEGFCLPDGSPGWNAVIGSNTDAGISLDITGNAPTQIWDETDSSDGDGKSLFYPALDTALGAGDCISHYLKNCYAPSRNCLCIEIDIKVTVNDDGSIISPYPNLPIFLYFWGYVDKAGGDTCMPRISLGTNSFHQNLMLSSLNSSPNISVGTQQHTANNAGTGTPWNGTDAVTGSMKFLDGEWMRIKYCMTMNTASTASDGEITVEIGTVNPAYAQTGLWTLSNLLISDHPAIDATGGACLNFVRIGTESWCGNRVPDNMTMKLDRARVLPCV